MCKNGGSCDYMKPNGDPKCSCVGGYSGLFCEEMPPGIPFRQNFNETVIHFIQKNKIGIPTKHVNNNQYVFLSLRNPSLYEQWPL